MSFLSSLPSSMAHDARDLALELVRSDPCALGQLSEAWRDRADVVLAAGPVAFRWWGSARLCADGEFVKKLLKTYLHRGADVLVDVMHRVCEVSPALFDDLDFVMALLRLNISPATFSFASERLRGDRDTVVATLAPTKGLSLKHATEELRNDRALVTQAFEAFVSGRRSRARPFLSHIKVSSDLLADRAFVLALVGREGRNFCYMPRFWGDREVALAAVRSAWDAAQTVADDLRVDETFVKTMLAIDGRTLKWLPPHFRHDPAYVRIAVDSHPRALRYASAALRDDLVMQLRCGMGDPETLVRGAHAVITAAEARIRETVEAGAVFARRVTEAHRAKVVSAQARDERIALAETLSARVYAPDSASVRQSGRELKRSLDDLGSVEGGR